MTVQHPDCHQPPPCCQASLPETCPCAVSSHRSADHDRHCLGQCRLTSLLELLLLDAQGGTIPCVSVRPAVCAPVPQPFQPCSPSILPIAAALGVEPLGIGGRCWSGTRPRPPLAPFGAAFEPGAMLPRSCIDVLGVSTPTPSIFACFDERGTIGSSSKSRSEGPIMSLVVERKGSKRNGVDESSQWMRFCQMCHERCCVIRRAPRKRAWFSANV